MVNFEHIVSQYECTGDWVRDLSEQLLSNVQDDPYWAAKVAACIHDGPARNSLHLAIFSEPYLELLIAGKKTVESRFSRNFVPPYKFINQGDLVLLKRTGAEVVAIASVAKTHFLERNDPSWANLRTGYQEALCATTDEFWNHVSDSWFGSLIWFDRIKPLPLLRCDKQDRRGWVILKPATTQLSLNFL